MMKRHPSLHPLSHDHHHGLVQARRLFRAMEKSPEEALQDARAFLEFARSALREHFRVEEEVLLPALLPYLPVASDEQCRRMLQEHQQIWQRVDSLHSAIQRDELPMHLLAETASLLERHIRFEEREMFPRLENLLSEEALQELGEMLRGQ